MEQRIGSSSQPLEGAGFDPAFIPGLTAPAVSSDKPEDTRPEGEETEDTEAEEPEAVAGLEKAAKSQKAEKSETTEKGTEEGDEEPDGESEGPVFEASDRRAEIVADEKGVRLRLDDQQCEFRWDEIGAIETESPRFGKRFTITVHTPDRRWYPIEIEATARSRFGEWETQLDAVLDAYFEDGEEAENGEEGEAAEATETVEAGGTVEEAGAAEPVEVDKD